MQPEAPLSLYVGAESSAPVTGTEPGSTRPAPLRFRRGLLSFLQPRPPRKHPYSNLFKEIGVFHRLVFRFTCLLVLSCAAFAQQFSADLVHLKPQTDVVTKVYVSGERLRFETTTQAHAGVAIMDLEKHTSLMLVPATKTYVTSAVARGRGPMPFFRPSDAENACEAWEKQVGKPGSCTKVGDETINGRSAVKYKGTTANGDTGFFWLDRQLNFVTKWEGEQTAAEFRNVKEGQQDASLFAVPSDYEKIDVPTPQRGSKGKKARPGMVPRQNPQNP